MMKNILAVVYMLGLLTAIFGAISLGIRLAKVHLGEKRGNVEKYLALPIAIFVIGFAVWVVTFFIVA